MSVLMALPVATPGAITNTIVYAIQSGLVGDCVSGKTRESKCEIVVTSMGADSIPFLGLLSIPASGIAGGVDQLLPSVNYLHLVLHR